MRNMFLGLFVFAMSFDVSAEAVVGAKKLQLVDSVKLYKTLLVLGHSSQAGDGDSSLIIHRTGFSSSDKAFTIQCENRVRGVDLGTECEIAVDSTLAQSGISTVAIGAVGNVVAVTLSSARDVDALRRSVTGQFGYFTSTETVQVKLPNESLRSFPRFRVDCDKLSPTCQVTLFP